MRIHRGKYYAWKQRYGRINGHNAWIPRDHWLEPWEKQKIIHFHDCYPLEGYRRLTYMMLDEDIVAASPSTVYRVLRRAGRLDRWHPKSSRKGEGFHQPQKPHQHWHVDLAYLNICGTFYYLCSILDGYSRSIVHHEIRESMKEKDVEIVLQRARERFPDATPRIISDNGPQFTAKGFKEFIRISGMTHVRTSPYYPQSNGKVEAWHKTVKVTTIRPKNLSSLEEARKEVAAFVNHYNHVRLHSAIGYIAPAEKLAGNEDAIWHARDLKLEQARKSRRERRRRTALVS
ncbi:MAG: IS3 family transposase [Cyanobacteria bacterium J06638_22]